MMENTSASAQASAATLPTRKISASTAMFLALYRLGFGIARPLLFRTMSSQKAHERTLALVRWLDDHAWTHPILTWMHKRAFVTNPVTVGGVTLPHPLILAAGFVKGEGFASEDAALAQVGRTIIPGWRSMPKLVGAVEFGSFTPHPRMGNPGIVMWRNEATRSTQNRVGLKNPGAKAAAEFLARRKDQLPDVYGINIAVSPGVSDAEQERREVLDALGFFLDRDIRPSWFTLNVSCPNTEDDPGSHQTETRTRDLCAAVTAALGDIPLWVKISPDLADEQYRALLRSFAQTGVKAVIASNTLGKPTPDGSGAMAGVGGGELHAPVVKVVTLLCDEIARQGYPLDLIACGGVEDGRSYDDFAALGVRAMQYMSAFIYRGPLAAALIEWEANGQK